MRARSLLLAVLCAASVAAQPHASDPAAFVQSFYETYPTKLEGGLPRGEELQWLGEFVSERLSQHFRAALAYQEEWIRQNPDHPPYYLKPPFADGVHFEGVPDAISAFKVLRAERRDRGTWYVPIYFWYDLESQCCDALVVVKEERGRYVIDDVLFLPTQAGDETWCLSDSLEWKEEAR